MYSFTVLFDRIRIYPNVSQSIRTVRNTDHASWARIIIPAPPLSLPIHGMIIDAGLLTAARAIIRRGDVVGARGAALHAARCTLSVTSA